MTTAYSRSGERRASGVDLAWDVHVVDGVQLVGLLVHNPAPVDRWVRLRNRLDGPVCPPRRRGVPEAGWDEAGYEGVVPAETTVSLGYGCPTGTPQWADGTADGDGGGDSDRDPVPDGETDGGRQGGDGTSRDVTSRDGTSRDEGADAADGGPPPRPVEAAEAGPEPPVAVADTRRAAPGARTEPTTPEAVVRLLGRAEPPADAIPTDRTPTPGGRDTERPSAPVSASGSSAGATRSGRGADEVETEKEGAERDTDGLSDAHDPDDTHDTGDGAAVAGEDAGTGVGDASPVGVEAVERWLDDVEGRIELAAGLTDASLSAATRGGGDAGGHDGGPELERAVAADAVALARVAARANRLAARAEGTDVPLEALEALA